MTLEIIGAGFGRTGTESMRLALNRLGFGPCHHMHEVIENPEQQRLWRALGQGAAPDWEALFDGYRSAVDWPSAAYWREIAAAYPEAKVLLTLRSTESWLASIEKTIFPLARKSDDPAALVRTVIAERTFGGRIDDPAHVAAVYERNSAEARASIPAERLLVYQVGDGWEPLCRFLGVPVPDEAFPRSNSTAEFNARLTTDPEGRPPEGGVS
ncbi:MAG: sulfotransferase family protein [Rhodospirillales bacterium]